jgi:hypothetical protein
VGDCTAGDVFSFGFKRKLHVRLAGSMPPFLIRLLQMFVPSDWPQMCCGHVLKLIWDAHSKATGGMHMNMLGDVTSFPKKL